MNKTPGVGDELLPVNPEWLLEDSEDDTLDLEIEDEWTEIALEEWSDVEDSDVAEDVDNLIQEWDLEPQESESELSDVEGYLVEEF